MVSDGAEREDDGTQCTSALIDSSRIDGMFKCTSVEFNAHGQIESSEKQMAKAQTTVRSISGTL
jgi:hypothetical protein